MVQKRETASSQALRLYRDLVDWYPIMRREWSRRGDPRTTPDGPVPGNLLAERIATAGFEPFAVPFEHSSHNDTGCKVFLGLRPVTEERA